MRPPPLLLAATLALAGCATSVGARGHAHRFTEYTSAHFVLKTDLPRDRALAAVRYLEQSRAAIATLLGPRSNSSIPRRDEVDVLADDLAWMHSFGRWMDGVTLSGGVQGERILMRGDPDRWDQRPTLALENTQSLLKHELTHALAARVFVRQPRWFAEGLASFVETVRISPDGTTALFGAPNLGALRNYHRSRTTTVQDILRWEDATLDARDDATLNSYYGQSWLLVHWLMNTHPAELLGLERALAHGEAPDRAWAEAMRDLDIAKLDSVLHAYSEHGDYQEISLPISGVQLGASERPLSDAEAHFFESEVLRTGARVLSEAHAERKIEADAELHAALALTPDDPVMLRSLHFGSSAERLAAAKRSVAAYPHEAASFRFLASTLGHTEEALAAWRQSLTLEGEDLEALGAVAGLEVKRHPEQALALAIKATLIEPRFVTAIELSSLAEAELGRCEDARREAARARDQLPEGLGPAEARALLAPLEDVQRLCP